MAFKGEWKVGDDLSVAWRIFFYAAIFIVIGAVATGFAYWLKPVWLGFERKAFVESHQYIEARQASIQTLKTELADVETKIAEYTAANEGGQYNQVLTNLRSQKEAIKRRIAAENAKLPADERR